LVRRPSTEASEHQTTLVVDAAPEFRLQMIAARTRRLDALLFTHDHADQCHGIDDIRAFALVQRARIACWMNESTRSTLMRRFGYIFEGEGLYPAIADAHITPPHGSPFEVDGPSGPIPVVTFDQGHGPIRSLGYRFDSVAYSSDLVELPDESLEALGGLDLWIVDALRYTPHPTHAHLEKTLQWIERLKPARAVLTNMHTDLDYTELSRRLPVGVEPARDGLTFRIGLA
jgi:phosphoribosyl 1,2-cyclic phosphate phosphodiesterase